MDKKAKHLIIALVIGIAAVFLNKLYLDARIGGYKDQRYVQVLRAKQQIRAGTPLINKLVDSTRVPAKFVPKARIPWGEKGFYLGQELAVDVLKGDYILESYFTTRASVGRVLSQQVESSEYRAINLPVDETNSLARSIVTGDHIDILFSFSPYGLSQKITTLLFQNVPIIATGHYSAVAQELGARGEGAGRYSSLTLKLPTQDAIRLNYARQMGTINILLRSGNDDKLADVVPIYNVEDLLSADEKQKVAALVEEEQKQRGLDTEKLKAQMRELLERQRQQLRSGK